MKTNPKGVLPALLKERAVLTSEVKRALANAKLDIKETLDREINELLYPYDVWLSIPEIRQANKWDETDLRWILSGHVELTGSERLDVPDGSMSTMPEITGYCNPQTGLQGVKCELSVDTKGIAHVNFRFAHCVVLKLDELRALFIKANIDLQKIMAPIKEVYDRLEEVNKVLREITNGTHGAPLQLGVLEDNEPYNSNTLGFDDDDHDNDSGDDLPPF
jgi:hypothetical protein